MKPYYQRDGIEIYNGDCLQIMPQLDRKFDLILTDPPYGISAEKTQNINAKSGRISNYGKWKEYDYFGWDEKRPSKEVFDYIIRLGKNIIIWGGNYFELPHNNKWLIWNKIQRSCMTDGEMAWTNKDGAIQIFDMSRTDAYINKCDGKFHPTQKPVELFKWCISILENPANILDPFLGSGTTLVAAAELHRQAVGIEIEEKYCEIAARRVERVLNQGELFN